MSKDEITKEYAKRIEEECRKMAQPMIDAVEELKKQGYTREEINDAGNAAFREYYISHLS
ncbi:MAG: hypothetical protein GQ474_08100 [Sulfurimonas sp.]|nr:hypothetical protein [Sulfurimonas sp.]